MSDWVARQNTNAHNCYLVFLDEQTHKKQLQRFYLAAFCAWHSETVPCIRANFYTPFLHTYFTYPFIAPFLIFIILNTPTRHINTFIYNTSKPKKILIISVLSYLVSFVFPQHLKFLACSKLHLFSYH